MKHQSQQTQQRWAELSSEPSYRTARKNNVVVWSQRVLEWLIMQSHVTRIVSPLHFPTKRAAEMELGVFCSIVLKTATQIMPALCAGCQLAPKDRGAACCVEDSKTALCYERNIWRAVEKKVSSGMGCLKSWEPLSSLQSTCKELPDCAECLVSGGVRLGGQDTVLDTIMRGYFPGNQYTQTEAKNNWAFFAELSCHQDFWLLAWDSPSAPFPCFSSLQH